MRLIVEDPATGAQDRNTVLGQLLQAQVDYDPNDLVELPPFATPGSRIDVSVSSMCDAKSLLGGSLVVTSLQGADGQVYAVAQGSIQTGAVSASGGSGSSVTRAVSISIGCMVSAT